MKIQAIIFMCNDFKRLDFTLDNLYKHNPDIPTLVINSGGDSPEHVTNKYDKVSLTHAPNLWHKKTHCGVGSFGPEYYEYLFDYGLNKDYTHTLFLETDVLTTRPITIEPKFDLSGPFNWCGGYEYVLYDYLGLKPKPHTGCGATMFSYNYFNVVKETNYNLYKELFESHPQNYFMDLISTLVGRKAGLTFGHWEEVTNIPQHFVGVNEGEYIPFPYYEAATLIHNYKV